MNELKMFRVKPDKKLDLNNIDPSYKGAHTSKEDALAETEHYRQKIAELQVKLYAQRKQSLLIVLQALDAAGKDGTVNHVISSLNPQGARVVGFKQPSAIDLEHDFLWRIHIHTPVKGEIVVFNRSHYEDVLVTRVHGLIDKPTWKSRYKRIHEFEKLLLDNNTHILKFFLHISKEEQLERFAKRIEDPARNWKISNSDYTEREYWGDYTKAYEDAISATTTKKAPWFVIPSNHKWYRNLAVSKIIAQTLESMDLAFPKPTVDLNEIKKAYYHAEQAQESE